MCLVQPATVRAPLLTLAARVASCLTLAAASAIRHLCNRLAAHQERACAAHSRVPDVRRAQSATLLELRWPRRVKTGAMVQRARANFRPQPSDRNNTTPLILHRHAAPAARTRRIGQRLALDAALASAAAAATSALYAASECRRRRLAPSNVDSRMEELGRFFAALGRKPRYRPPTPSRAMMPAQAVNPLQYLLL